MSFQHWGDMEQFRNGIAYFRGYRLRLFLIIQDTEQLKGIYEEAGMNSFLSNSTYRITFAANKRGNGEILFHSLWVIKRSEQISRNSPIFLDLNPASRSKHVSEAQPCIIIAPGGNRPAA